MIGVAVADQAERDRLTVELDRTLFIEAGAGTGKTTAVVSRVVALVAAGRLQMDKLVAITFTIAAAGELRVRIREGLEDGARDAADADERRRLSTAAAEVDRARIETIHAFCSALLRMHPLEAQLPPDVRTLADLAGAIDVRERFRLWFDELTPGSSGGNAVARALLLGLAPDRILKLFIVLNENWDLVVDASWTADPVRVLQEARTLGRAIEECIGLLSCCRTPDALYTRVEALLIVSRRLQDAQTEDEAIAALVVLDGTPRLGQSGQVGNWSPAGGTNACTTIKATMRHVQDRCAELLVAARSAALGAVAGELRDVVLAYAEERRTRGLVSYQDLLVRARDLVRDHADVRAALRTRWAFIAVDEFQDTDPLQAELALRLCAAVDDPSALWTELRSAPGRLCVVGDPKQSIYRFRRADIALYAAVERSLLIADPPAKVRLSVNFRSGRRIIDVVNHVFGDGLMPRGAAPDGIQATYVDLACHAPELEGSVSVVGGAVDGKAADMWREEARATAATIRHILAGEWIVGDGTAAGPHPCGPKDICVLMPSRTNLRNMERELERARIRYRLESGSLIVSTQEVRDLLNILRAIDDSSDEVALVAALRTPAYGCSDAELVRWRGAGGRWSCLWPGEGTEPRVLGALDHLRSLHEQRHGMSVPRLIDEILGARLLRAAAFDDWRPRETRRRYRFVADQARALATSGRPSLHDAVDYLERLARDQSYDSRATDDGDDEPCVRLMTIHAAKGLEFPIVLVTGLGRKPSAQRPLLIPDRENATLELRLGEKFTTTGWEAINAREKQMEEAERVRLLYVALTRARDHLVISRYRGGGAPGDATDAGRIAALLHGHPLVTELDLDGLPAVGLAAATEGGTADPAEHRAAEEAWQARRAAVIHSLGVVRAVTATGLAHADEEADPQRPPVEDVAASRRGRGGTSLGRAVHAVLEVVDLRADAGLDALAAVAAAAEGIPDRVEEVARLAHRAWESEPVRRAAAARHWREVPLGAPIDGTVLEGFVDLLYELPDGRLVVVDYKTDAVTGAGIDARMRDYAVQGGVYALLVAETTGKDVTRIEFVFAAPGETRTITDVAGVVAEVRALLAGTVGQLALGL